MTTKPEISELSGIHYATRRPVRIEIENGFIIRASDEGVDDINDRDTIIAPGLIDNQINGYQGINFADEFLTTGSLKMATEAIWKDGVTSFMPTLVTDSHDKLKRSFRMLARASSDEFFKGCIPGFHLEGPYLSPEPGFYGCHPAQYLRKPSWFEFTEYQEAAMGRIMEVTIAPELEDAGEFIRLSALSGVIVSIGHTNATAEQIDLAVKNGAKLSTHLGNGCANLIDRHRNPLWPQLANKLLTPSIIADGHHLLPEEIVVFYKVKGPKNMILTSDVTHLIGMPPGEYVYLGARVIKTIDGLVKNPELDCLAGASLPLKKGLETMMDYTGCSLGEAVNLAARNVARIYNLSDRGAIGPGKRADLILFKNKGNKITIKETYVKGVCVFRA
jgi:N-acetylglucosamine-6-phosphate deacetylase